MSCSVPGCLHPPEHREEVQAGPVDDLRHLDQRRASANAALCPIHRAEFEALGWLAPLEEPQVFDTQPSPRRVPVTELPDRELLEEAVTRLRRGRVG